MRLLEFLNELVDPFTPEFRKWFAKSVVIDDKARPLKVYHGTTSGRKFEKLRAFSHFGTMSAASHFTGTDDLQLPGRMYPVYLRIQNPATMIDEWSTASGQQHNSYGYLHDLQLGAEDNRLLEALHELEADWMEELGVPDYLHLQNVVADRKLMSQWWEQIFEQNPPGEAKRMRQLIKVLMSLGYDGIWYKNIHEDKGSDSWIPFSQRQIKYVYAEGTFYHGSQHGHEKFDYSKIGSGEGAQVYGYGLYFAEHPEVAQHYSQMGDAWAEYKGQKILYPWHRNKDTIPSEVAFVAELMVSSAGDINKAKAKLKQSNTAISMPKFARKVWDNFEQLAAQIQLQSTQHVYTVEIPDQVVAASLRWDEPFDKQPQNVQAALKQAFEEFDTVSYHPATEGWGYYDRISQHYHNLPKEGWPKTSAWLNQHGVPGIRYLDQESRREGFGTYNVVLFDDKHVKIVDRRTPLSKGK